MSKYYHLHLLVPTYTHQILIHPLPFPLPFPCHLFSFSLIFHFFAFTSFPPSFILIDFSFIFKCKIFLVFFNVKKLMIDLNLIGPEKIKKKKTEHVWSCRTQHREGHPEIQWWTPFMMFSPRLLAVLYEIQLYIQTCLVFFFLPNHIFVYKN